jgi:hypothetical protein
VNELKQYDTNLAMGLGLIDETKVLLDTWTPPMSATDLYEKVLESGALSHVSAYRLRNIIVRAFGARYLTDDGGPALALKRLVHALPSPQLEQLFYLYTARANPIFADFVREVYWPAYQSAVSFLTKPMAEGFIWRGIDDNKTRSRWAEGQVMRVGRYLTGCCTDFGLLGAPSRGGRPLRSYATEPNVFTYLAYDLHFKGIGDNALLSHEDWGLFGLERQDVLEAMKRNSLKGHFIVQAAGDVVRIDWKHRGMEALCDVLAQS